MKAFQGIQYSTILEEEGRKTTAAIIMPLFRNNMSEIIFVVSSDHLISGEGYKDNILEAKQLVQEANLVTIGMPIKEPDTRFGYIHPKDLRNASVCHAECQEAHCSQGH